MYRCYVKSERRYCFTKSQNFTDDCMVGGTNLANVLVLHPRGWGGGSGVAPGNSSSGCAARLSHLPHLFSDQTSNIHTRFHTWPLGRGYVIITQIRAQTKNFSNAFRIRIFLFRSYSFGVETITSFIRSRSSLENHTRIRTKIGKVYTRFHTKKAPKPNPLGQRIPIRLI